MTGDEAYHADCFRCTQCDAKIDDLVFAKTSQGIYCMKCHQERKEAKRQREREERERMERTDRGIEKSLPTIPEAERKPPADPISPRPTNLPERQHQAEPAPERRPYPDMQRPQHLPQTPLPTQHIQPTQPTQPTQSNHLGGHNGAQSGLTPRVDSRPKANGNNLPSLDVGPPFLPPLVFGLDDTASSGFDLGDMLSGSEKDSKDSSPPTPSKDAELIYGQDRSSFRVSIARADARLSTSTVNIIEKANLDDIKSLSEIPSSPTVITDKRMSGHPLSPASRSPSISEPTSPEDNMSPAESAALIRELRLELAKHNPTNPLIHGTRQQEYGLLLEKTEKLTQKHTQLEKALRDLYIEKDLLGMDLEAMNEEIKLKEEALASSSTDKLHPAATAKLNPRMSTSHDFMKQAYQTEVKALQEQKERLQREIQAYAEQRDGILDEMQILSVRNAELSTINNDMMRDMHERKDAKATPAAPSASSGSSMLQSFTGKMRRQRQASEGSQQDLKAPQLAVARSSDSTYSFNSTNSEDPSRKGKRDEIQEDIFGEEIVAPKKFSWKKGTINTLNTGVSTVKSVGAMFGKMIVEVPEAPSGKAGNALDDTGSGHGQILPPRSYSVNSETSSLNGRHTEQHYFSQYNYLKPAKCDCCDDKLWGREYRCRGCGFQIHGRCSHEIIPGCSGKMRDSDSSSLRNVTPSGGSNYGVPPPPPAKQIMFGNDLLDQLELEQRTIPLVVEKCIEAVDERGLDVEGIYRRSGMAAEARQLVQAYDIGLQPDLMDSTLYQDICSITSVLKQYLRSLPEPLVPYDLYNDFLDAIVLPYAAARIQFHKLLDRMPYAHYETLKVLLEHLNRVTKLESVNLMTPKNLSVVFGPTLMRNPDPSKEIFDTSNQNMTIEFLIKNTADIFVRGERPSMSSTSSGGESLAGPGKTGRAGTEGPADAPHSDVTPIHASGQGTSLPGAVTVAAAGGFPKGFTGQRQESIGSINQSQIQNQMGTPPPPPPTRRMPGHLPSPVLSQDSPGFSPILPPRSSSGESVPTMSQVHPLQQPQPHYGQQQHHQYQQQQQQFQYANQHLNQQQQFYRPQQFQPPQHQTLQQLKHQQQQREQQQREQQQQQWEQQQREQHLQREREREQKEHEQKQQQKAALTAAVASLGEPPSLQSPPPQSLQSPPPQSPTPDPELASLVQEQQHQQANPEVDMTNFP
ncbi:hypothetical protein EDD21DRAFT_411395 [Dissophora ornata]|nr:hypothetical protein EDD21DRAFT_411395 [Dissophora ornata]